MNNFIIYSIEIAISLALFYIVYWVFLKNETFFKLNRFYLMFSVLISLLLPLLNIKIISSTYEDSFISKYLVMPIQHYEQSLIGNIDYDNTATNSAVLSNHKKNFANKKEVILNKANKNELSSAVPIPANLSEGSSFGKKINWLIVVMTIYFTGMALFLLRFIANFIWIFRNTLIHSSQKIGDMKVIKLKKNMSPFSFLNFIFMSHKDYPDAELTKIISHEKVHFQQKHSIDLVLFELLLVFQWFNPFVWLYKRAIKINHEYLADYGTLNSGIDMPSYQYSLLNQVLSENNIEIASNYNLSIKKRIFMMAKKRSSKLSALKSFIALPILVILFSAFAFKTIYAKKEVATNLNSKLSINGDTSIKRVNVPLDYLKQLEGEYISTNEPGRVRKIIFTELLGTLHGWDAGYAYKIIPVGEGKFINPDDHASLVFDTKDNNAISLLLFGTINLKKVNVSKDKFANRSKALTLVNTVLKDGITAANSQYKSIKDSSNYYFSENEMNIAGYELLQSGKTKEAAAIFKFNTQLSPSSFNTFDSYGEALLVLGDKTQAIENFKESVKLNPGSKNGLTRLKELGINTDDLVKKYNIAIDELKLLEGDYLSTNEPKWMRWIKFVVEDGVLIGNDNGYRYKLLPMGNGKFINPDDGVNLVFDTKDKNAISLLIFGNTTLKKAKKYTFPPLVNLKNYSGVYLPSKKDSILRPMEIINSETKLFRFILDAEGTNRTIELESVTDNTFFYTDNSGRSIEFILDNKNQVTGCILRRYDGAFTLTKKK